MAPMSRSFSPGGVPGADVAAYYRRRAEVEVGLILCESTTIGRPASRNEPDLPCFHWTASLAGWKGMIDEVHAGGGWIGPQIFHAGSVKNPRTDWELDIPVESPSGLAAAGQPRGRAMTERDIGETIAAFGRAAADARRLEFDVVEIHGAHGYLIDQFFWGATNLRTDGYGGATLKERGRFAVKVMRAVRMAVGPDFPVILRLSQWKVQDLTARLARTPGEMADWLVPLREAGVDAFHCSQRRFWESEFSEVDGPDGLNFAGWAKKLTGAVAIGVGSVGLSGAVMATIAGETSTSAGLDGLDFRMEREEFNLIAVGRALLDDPGQVHKVRMGDFAALQGFNPALLAQLV